MLGALSVYRSTDTSTETTAPLADSSIHDQMVKTCPLVDHTHLKFVNVGYSGSLNFLLSPESRCYSWLGSDPVTSAATVLEKWSRTFRSAGIDGVSCSMCQSTVLLKDKTRLRDIRNMPGSSFLARRLSWHYASLTLTPGMIKWILVQPLISYYLSIMWKFSTFVFNKVVWLQEWGEAENVYMAYDFGNFFIYLPKVIN